MFIQGKMITFLVMIFLVCNALAKGSEMCDQVKFSFNDQNNNLNFTKQSLEKNGKPVYYAADLDIQTYIWWNNNTNTWLSQTRPFSGNRINKRKTKISHRNLIFAFLNNPKQS